MELLRRLPRKRLGKQMVSMGLFLCPICDKEVEKLLSNGKATKSCGCLEWRNRPRPGKKTTYGLKPADVKQMRAFYLSGKYSIQTLARMKSLEPHQIENVLGEKTLELGPDRKPLHARLYKFFSELST